MSGLLRERNQAMKAWLTARRVKAGHEDEFRKKWRGGDTPEGMVDAFLLEDEQDPRETLSVSLWDTAQNLLSYRTASGAAQAATGPSAGMSTPAGTATSAAAGHSSATISGASHQKRGRTVRDFMTSNPETVNVNTDAATAAAMMRDLDVGVLPV